MKVDGIVDIVSTFQKLIITIAINTIFIAMCDDLNIDKQQSNYALRKITAIIIRSSYYIFCMRNKPRANPDLLTY